MDLRSISNSVSNTVNSNIPVTVLRSTGFSVGAGRKQVPTYAAPVSGFGQMQALDAKDLQQLDGLNIQGKIKAIYLYGELAGVIRPDQTGGDIVQIDGKDWLVVKVLEGWSTWTKVACTLQA